MTASPVSAAAAGSNAFAPTSVVSVAAGITALTTVCANSGTTASAPASPAPPRLIIKDKSAGFKTSLRASIPSLSKAPSFKIVMLAFCVTVNICSDKYLISEILRDSLALSFSGNFMLNIPPKNAENSC